MGLLSSITKLFQKDPPVSECCVDGVCVCSSDGDDLVSDVTVATTTATSAGVVTISTDTDVPTSTSSTPSTVEFTPQSVASADEINIALETAAEADREAAENYTPTPPPAAPPKKKRANAKKASSKLNRKSTTRKKKS